MSNPIGGRIRIVRTITKNIFFALLICHYIVHDLKDASLGFTLSSFLSAISHHLKYLLKSLVNPVIIVFLPHLDLMALCVGQDIGVL